MLRRVTSIGVLVASAVIGITAAERATFILTDGERKSGQVVFHGSERENLINGYLSLGNDTGGPEFGFPLSQVAVIDFVGGQPPQTELAKIPQSGHYLTLRSGQSQDGTFINMVDGTTVLWKNSSGETQRYAMTDVSRIYLNPQSARTAFNYTGSSATPVGTAGQSAAAPAGSVQVQANTQWNDGGITVKKGDKLVFSVAGEVSFAQGATAGPDGNGSFHKQTYPVPTLPVGALIARVGAGTPFGIGTISRPIDMPDSGRLMLGVNDDELGDNSGAFTVTVTPVRR
jgi:hypothetical protein